MDISAIIQDFLTLMQQLQPGMEAALTTGKVVGAAGATLVTVLQKGKQLITYFARKKTSTKKKTAVDAQNKRRAAGAGKLAAIQRDIAIVVDISRRSLRDVERYLMTNMIDADLIVVTNDPRYGPQTKSMDENDPQDWLDVVQDFNMTINAIKHELGATNMHIFISAPVAIAFGLGTVCGTVDRVMVYHWNQTEYKRVLSITRDLRFG